MERWSMKTVMNVSIVIDESECVVIAMIVI